MPLKFQLNFLQIQQSTKKLNEGRRRVFLFWFWRGKRKGEAEEEDEEEKKAFHFLSGGKEKRGLLGWYRNNNFVLGKTKISVLVEIIEAPV
jgi:hypothetical protein